MEMQAKAELIDAICKSRDPADGTVSLFFQNASGITNSPRPVLFKSEFAFSSLITF